MSKKSILEISSFKLLMLQTAISWLSPGGGGGWLHWPTSYYTDPHVCWRTCIDSQTHPTADKKVLGKVKLSKFLNGSNSNFRAFRAPMALATRAWQPVRGSLWVLEYPYCHQMMPQTDPKAIGNSSKQRNMFKKTFNCH